MRIVHYTLGLYPNRSGGLNRYATDLMFEQAKEHDVAVLLPGRWLPWRKNCKIRRGGSKKNVQCYYLDNSLPIPLLYGIKKPGDFLDRPIAATSFEKFLKEVRPDVFHLHTMMGMPESALSFFKRHGVKIVYTSHDYFGICPKVNLINKNGLLCDEPGPLRCERCNAGSPSTLFLRLRNSNAAFATRDFIKWLKTSIHF